jgi:hypothetical protein
MKSLCSVKALSKKFVQRLIPPRITRAVVSRFGACAFLAPMRNRVFQKTQHNNHGDDEFGGRVKVVSRRTTRGCDIDVQSLSQGFVYNVVCCFL